MDTLHLAAELAVGLGATRVSASQVQRGSSVYVDSIFSLVQVQDYVSWLGTIDGQNVRGNFAGPVPVIGLGTRVRVRGWVQKYPPQGNLPTQYAGNVTVTIGQRTNVTQWLSAFVTTPIASAAPTYGISSRVSSAAFALAGIPGETDMNTHNELHLAAGLGALMLSLDRGLGILGPYGANPAQMVAAGTYEVSGTQVNLHSDAGGSVGAPTGNQFNAEYGANNNIVAGAPDQVDFDGQTGTSAGLTFAHVTVKTGKLAGSKGFVAVEYMAPVGWTSQHGGTGPVPAGGGGGQTVSTTSESTGMTTDYVPWILGGAAVLGLGIVGWAIFSKPKHGAAGRRSRRMRHARA